MTEPRPLSAEEEALFREGLATAPTQDGTQLSLLDITTTTWADRCRLILATLDAARVEAEQAEEAALVERDAAEEWADRLALAIAPIEVIGEHSSANDPWANALEAAAARTPAEPRIYSPESVAQQLAGHGSFDFSVPLDDQPPAYREAMVHRAGRLLAILDLGSPYAPGGYPWEGTIETERQELYEQLRSDGLSGSEAAANAWPEPTDDRP